MAVDREALEEYVAVGKDIRRLSTEALQRLIASLDLTDARDAVAALERLLPALIEQWGVVSATAAADYYERSRPKELPRPKRVLAAAVVDDIGPSLFWAATPLFQAEQDVQSLTDRLTKLTDERVKMAGTDTFLEMGNAEKKVKPRFARVPVGKTCQWCRMLASRGFVYSSKVAEEAKTFHSSCDCTFVADFSESPSLEGYEPEKLKQEPSS